MGFEEDLEEFIDIEDDKAVLFSDFQGLEVSSIENSIFWRNDVYDNNYFNLNNEVCGRELMSVETKDNSFSGLMKNVLAFFNNFYTLNRNKVGVPNFEAGVYRNNRGFIQPYFLMEKPRGRCIEDLDEVFSEVIIAQKGFESLNETGRRLAASNKISYSEERKNKDVYFDFETGDFSYINPGTFTDECLYGQFSKNVQLPSSRNIGSWFNENYWDDLI